MWDAPRRDVLNLERHQICPQQMPLLQWTREVVDPRHPLLETDLQGDDGQDEDDSEVSLTITPRVASRDWNLYKGLIFSCCSSLFFSLCSVIVKLLYHMHPGELACFRFMGILVFTMPVVIQSRQDFLGPKELRHFLVLRGLAGSTSLFLRFCAVHYLPIADANVIIFSVPVFVSVLARIFLKEPCGLFHIFNLTLTFVGLALVTKLPIILSNDNDSSGFSNHDHFWGVTTALASTIFGACVYIVVRKVKSVHHSVIMFNFGWVAVLETTLLTLGIGQFTLPFCGWDRCLVVLLAIFSFCGQVMLTRALQLEQAGPVSVVRAATDIVFVFIWQVLFFEEIPDWYSISGAILVTTCVILTSVRKWLMALPEYSKHRKRLFFFTI